MQKIGFAHCLQAEWQYLPRCVPAVGPLLAPDEAVIHDKLITVPLGGMPDWPSAVAGGLSEDGLAGWPSATPLIVDGLKCRSPCVKLQVS